jgi:long-subunit acyl-CoA synthetase (AMP-forming)
MLASLMYGINIVVLDSFKNKNKREKMIKLSNAKYVFTNNKTHLLSKILFKGLKSININDYQKESKEIFNYDVNKQNTVLTTFTSGTTGIPKIINRSFIDLEKQVELLNQNFELDEKDTIICMLPIYILFSIFSGFTTCITNKITNKQVEKLKANIILGKISKVLNIKEKITKIKKVYLGGAYIYNEEATTILNTFPNANIYYIYGASEVVIMGINNLLDFKNHKRFKIANGIELNIIDNIEKVGEIKAKGTSLKNEHCTGDIGYIEDNYLYVLGRKKYSSLENKLYKRKAGR